MVITLIFLEMDKLYVIGNGFDKHHGMPCGYIDFKKWLRNNRQDVYDNLMRLYGDIDVANSTKNLLVMKFDTPIAGKITIRK